MSTPELTPEERADFEALLDYIKRNRGFDFTGYKRPTLTRRIGKRARAIGVASFADYRDYLEANPDEFATLFDTILINVTSFFRDAPAWDYIGAEIVPRIVESKAPNHPIRVWSTGCATGEEAYTTAMLFAEALGDDAFRQRVKIYATDVDEDALGSGRHGRYSTEAVEPVPEQFRTKYLERLDGHHVFRGDLRRSVIFGRHDLLQDPPISRVDLLLARNTLMYFNPDTQARVLANFHFALMDTGFLFLGKSEVLLTRSNLFVPVDLKRRVFQPTPKVAFRERLLDLVHDHATADDGGPEARELRTRDAAFDATPAAVVVIDAAGALAMVNLQARLLFGLSQRDLRKPFHELELSYRPVELRSRIEEADRGRHPVVIRDVELKTASGDTRFVDLHIAPLLGPDGHPLGTSVSAVDITRYRALQEAIERSKADLETAYEELQATTEELETTNEELQSTNEELETMNEELQSTNEELETMNDELRVRTDDLNAVNAFFDAILTGLQSGVAVLDSELRVRAWNAAAEDLWGLRPNEVEGEHFLGLDIGLPVGELAKPLRAALDGGNGSDHLLPATNRRGRAIEATVRIAPMNGVGPDGAGLIVLMEDGSAAA